MLIFSNDLEQKNTIKDQNKKKIKLQDLGKNISCLG